MQFPWKRSLWQSLWLPELFFLDCFLFQPCFHSCHICCDKVGTDSMNAEIKLEEVDWTVVAPASLPGLPPFPSLISLRPFKLKEIYSTIPILNLRKRCSFLSLSLSHLLFFCVCTCFMCLRLYVHTCLTWEGWRWWYHWMVEWPTIPHQVSKKEKPGDEATASPESVRGFTCSLRLARNSEECHDITHWRHAFWCNTFGIFKSEIASFIALEWCLHTIPRSKCFASQKHRELRIWARPSLKSVSKFRMLHVCHRTIGVNRILYIYIELCCRAAMSCVST